MALMSLGALETFLDAARSQHTANPSSESHITLAEAHRALQFHMVDLTSKQLHMSAQLHEHSGKNGKLLAYLARSDFLDSSIPEIKLPDETVTSDSLVINQTFASFYSHLDEDLISPSEATFAVFFTSDFPYP